jgi:hypothetical protein
MSDIVTKRLSRDTNYKKKQGSYQENLSPKEIKEKLQEYKQVNNITDVALNTHLRYFTINKSTGEKQFRLGGFLSKIDPEGKYIILNNKTLSWSVQIKTSIFFQKMSFTELKQELTEKISSKFEHDIRKLKEENKLLKETIREIKHKAKKK